MLRTPARLAAKAVYRRHRVPPPPAGKAPLQLPVFKLSAAAAGIGVTTYYITKFISSKILPSDVEEDIEDDSTLEEIITMKSEENTMATGEKSKEKPGANAVEPKANVIPLQQGFYANPDHDVIAAVHVHVFELFADYKGLTAKAIDLCHSTENAEAVVGFSADLLKRLKKKMSGKQKFPLRIDEEALELKAETLADAGGFIPPAANHFVFLVRGANDAAVAEAVESIGDQLQSVARVKVVPSPRVKVAWPTATAGVAGATTAKDATTSTVSSSSWWPWKSNKPSAAPASAAADTAAAQAQWPVEWLQQSLPSESGSSFLHTSRWVFENSAAALPPCDAHRTAVTPAVFNMFSEGNSELWSVAAGPSITAVVAERRRPPHVTGEAALHMKCRASGMFYVPSEQQLQSLCQQLQ